MAEIDRALAAGAEVVGVNSRNLSTFAEDLGVASSLSSRLPAAVVAVAESAVRSPADAAAMADAGFDAVLVGEALVRADDPDCPRARPRRRPREIQGADKHEPRRGSFSARIAIPERVVQRAA